MSSVHMCSKNFVPFLFLLLMPFGPSVPLNGSLLVAIPTLQLTSCPRMNLISRDRLLSMVCVIPLNSSCLAESTGWYKEHSAIFVRPLTFLPWLSLFLKCSCSPRKRPLYLCFAGSVMCLLSASLCASSNSGLSMMHTPPITCPMISFVFSLFPFIITL